VQRGLAPPSYFDGKRPPFQGIRKKGIKWFIFHVASGIDYGYFDPSHYDATKNYFVITTLKVLKSS